MLHLLLEGLFQGKKRLLENDLSLLETTELHNDNSEVSLSGKGHS